VTPIEVVDSISRHFLAGCPNLSISQLREHEATGTCPECRDRAKTERSRASLIDRIMDEELPRYAGVLERLGEGP
jgi:hypothetical protein